MAQAVYIRPAGVLGYEVSVAGNPSDTVTVTGPKGTSTITLSALGNAIYKAKKKGEYTFKGNQSQVSKTINVVSKSVDYEVDVSFSETVIVKTNPNATVTISSSALPAYSVSGTADSNGDVTIQVKRTGSLNITNDESSGDYSTSPLSSETITCDNNGGSLNVICVKVHPLDSISVGTYASQSAYGCYDISGEAPSNFTGVRVIYKEGSAATSVTDGFSVGTGIGNDIKIDSSTTKKGYNTPALVIGKTYYISIYPYVAIGGTNYFGISKYSTWTCVATAGKAAFTASGAWYVPAGIRNITVFAAGSGGSGGTGRSTGSSTIVVFYGAGGGGGYVNRGSKNGLNPGDKISFSIGPGGGAVVGESAQGNDGSTTIVYFNDTEWFRASGGQGGCKSPLGGHDYMYGGSGGSGGGVGGISQGYYGGNGGSNGASGDKAHNYQSTDFHGHPGSGQGASNVLFDNTYYSGGGGGASNYGAGNGGNWGGGKGCYLGYGAAYSAATAGTAGSGGGGGGGAVSNSDPSGAGGSGTVVILYT